MRIKEASFPAPFAEGLEYSAPARGTWNIVHTGMLIPESHQIFVCAQGCLRGVVLTAAEAGCMDRYSAIAIREDNVLNGDMEELMVDGVADILGKLKKRPRVILLFISCQHFFLAYNREQVFAKLREKYPEIDFLDCYMIPTLRKSGMTPDQKMRIQMFSLLQKRETEPKQVNLLGSNLPLDKDCELRQLLKGYQLCQINDCQSYEDYLALAKASLNLYYEPLAALSMKEMEEKLGIPSFYLPFTFSFGAIEKNYEKLAEKLGILLPDFTPYQKEADEAMKRAKEALGDIPVVLDQTLTFRILDFSRLLLSYGIKVTTIYADRFLPEEEENFLWLKKHYPEIELLSCSEPKMRFQRLRVPEIINNESGKEKILALGQKAAYFAGTDYFVNVVESGGYFGYKGIVKLAEEMVVSVRNSKDTRDIIQRKGYGCESCI